MLQKNPGPYVYDLPTLGVRLLPGEEIDHPSKLAGLVQVDEDDDTDSREVVARSDNEPAKEVI